MSSNGWCTIESDPEVFNEMLERFGVEGVSVEELISIDAESIAALGKVYGIVLLFKYKKVPAIGNVSPDGLYFARQVVNNACATQAILNTLLNFPKDVALGPNLTQFLDFTGELDPATRGEMLGQFEVFREAHNSFAHPATFEFEERAASKDDDVFHFTSFVYKNGGVYELDGLQEGPIRVSAATDDDFRAKLAEAVQAKVQLISAADSHGRGQGISFALMAISEDRELALEQQVALLASQDLSTIEVSAELERVKAARAKGRLENSRRRHNYIPALVALFKALEEKGKLAGIVDAAKKAAEQRKANGNKSA